MSNFGLFLVTLKNTKQKGDITGNVTTVHQADGPAGTNAAASTGDGMCRHAFPG